jgi:hypothetical protein
MPWLFAGVPPPSFQNVISRFLLDAARALRAVTAAGPSEETVISEELLIEGAGKAETQRQTSAGLERVCR